MRHIGPSFDDAGMARIEGRQCGFEAAADGADQAQLQRARAGRALAQHAVHRLQQRRRVARAIEAAGVHQTQRAVGRQRCRHQAGEIGFVVAVGDPGHRAAAVELRCVAALPGRRHRDHAGRIAQPAPLDAALQRAAPGGRGASRVVGPQVAPIRHPGQAGAAREPACQRVRGHRRCGAHDHLDAGIVQQATCRRARGPCPAAALIGPLQRRPRTEQRIAPCRRQAGAATQAGWRRARRRHAPRQHALQQRAVRHAQHLQAGRQLVEQRRVLQVVRVVAGQHHRLHTEAAQIAHELQRALHAGTAHRREVVADEQQPHASADRCSRQ